MVVSYVQKFGLLQQGSTSSVNILSFCNIYRLNVMSKNQPIPKNYIVGLQTQNSGFFQVPEKKPPFFKESQTLKENFQNSRTEFQVANEHPVTNGMTILDLTGTLLNPGVQAA